MKRFKQTLSLALAGVMMTAAPTAAFAASPEFARSAEEWAKLQDNKIEYDEIADLVHEYNATVQKNAIDLGKFRKDYGDTNEKWADRYRELADDLEASLSYPDVDDASYASIMTQIVTSEMQIDSWRKSADEAVDDYMTYYYNYASAEAMLTSNAQQQMIAYYVNQLQLELDQKNQELLNETIQSVQTQKSLGMATDVDVLTAEENLRNANKAILDDQNTIENNQEKLFVTLGWKHDGRPEVGTLPDPDVSRIAAMNPEADKAQAVENSYTMKINKRKLENAKSEDTKETLEKTIREDTQKIGAAVTSSYQNVLAAKATMDLRQAQSELQEKTMQTTERQYQLGMLGRLDYLNKKYAYDSAVIQAQTAKYNLLQAIQSYDWVLNGLANAS
ncbi:TolC family protein [Clostridium sp. AF32-12BH]|uniref:TolC family protein n=1 Tax=Clostridium sp. AF32-12BH TaxID=2292006 RepID=UPI0015FD1AC7|nr:TolC family protein [Clostridium sp. AF32-12BH]